MHYRTSNGIHPNDDDHHSSIHDFPPSGLRDRHNHDIDAPSSPITTDSMSYSNVEVTVGQPAGQGFVPIPSVNIPPITVTVTGPDGKSTGRTLSLPPWPDVTQGPPRIDTTGGPATEPPPTTQAPPTPSNMGRSGPGPSTTSPAGVTPGTIGGSASGPPGTTQGLPTSGTTGASFSEPPLTAQWSEPPDTTQWLEPLDTTGTPSSGLPLTSNGPPTSDTTGIPPSGLPPVSQEPPGQDTTTEAWPWPMITTGWSLRPGTPTTGATPSGSPNNGGLGCHQLPEQVLPRMDQSSSQWLPHTGRQSPPKAQLPPPSAFPQPSARSQ